MKIKKGGKIFLIILVLVGAFFGIRWYQNKPKEVGKSELIGQIAIPDAPDASLDGSSSKLNLPSDVPAFNGGLQITHYEMAWQSQTGFNYANGGARTTKGSLFDQAGLDIQIIRQDDCLQSVQSLVKWTQEYKEGKTKSGVFCTYMASGIDQYVHAISEAVKDLGPEYQPVAFMSPGKSFGEDQVIGDASYKKNPLELKGKVLRGVRMDGDIDLVLKFCGDNGVEINANDQVYDKNALNLSYAKDFLSAVTDYNTGQKETRHIIINGKTTGKDTTVGIDLVATWTPGDVNAIVKGKGGATIISTKQYASMMSAITITCKKFLNDNRDKLGDMVAAIAMAGDQIRSFTDVKKFACGLNAKIWKEESAEYWLKYYDGVDHNSEAHLGGSMVYNLADMDKQFGLRGGPDIFREVYNTFGKLHSKLYPKDLPEYMDYTKAMDKSIMLSVISNHPELLQGKPLEVKYADQISNTVASKNVSINFETGSAVIDPSSYDELNAIYSSAVAAEGLKVGIKGHTDNTGNSDNNLQLSRERAASVKKYLINKGLSENRIESSGYGDKKPIEDNATAAGRAKNRRVEIVLGN